MEYGKKIAGSLLLVVFVLGVALPNDLCQIDDQDPSSILAPMLSYFLLILPGQLAFLLCLAILWFSHRLSPAINNAMVFLTTALAVVYPLISLSFLARKRWGSTFF